MANWNDPQPRQTGFGASPSLSGEATGRATYDVGLRRHMLSIYNYMASGVLLSGIVALLFAQSGFAAQIMMSGGALAWLIILSPLAFVFAMSFGANRFSTPALQAMFWGFATVMGLSLSTIFLAYSSTAIATSFFGTAAAFAGLSLYGYTTKRDLSAMGTFFLMGLIGLIVAMVINLFVHSSGLSMVISLVGVLLFAGLTAYDTQRTKSIYAHVAGTPMMARVVIMSALNLYLNFINMFLFILRLQGGGGRN